MFIILKSGLNLYFTKNVNFNSIFCKVNLIISMMEFDLRLVLLLVFYCNGHEKNCILQFVRHNHLLLNNFYFATLCLDSKQHFHIFEVRVYCKSNPTSHQPSPPLPFESIPRGEIWINPGSKILTRVTTPKMKMPRFRLP